MSLKHDSQALTFNSGKENFIAVFRPLAYVWFDVAGNHNCRLNGTEVFVVIKIYLI